MLSFENNYNKNTCNYENSILTLTKQKSLQKKIKCILN